MAQYEAITEPLVRVFGVLGHWGDGNEFSMAAEVLQALGKNEFTAGVRAWNQLRSYPAVLLLYAYGLGLLKARRIDVLFRWFATKIHEEYNPDRDTAVGTLFLSTWKPSTGEFWQQLEGAPHPRGTLSDHLHQVFQDWSRDYVFTGNEYTKLFGTFETFGSLAYLTFYASEEELASASTSQQPSVWAPVGRTARERDIQEVIQTELLDQEYRSLLLEAGFAKGDEAFLSSAIEVIEQIMSSVFRQSLFR